MSKPCFGYDIRYARNVFGAEVQTLGHGPVETWDEAWTRAAAHVAGLKAQGFVIIDVRVSDARLFFLTSGRPEGSVGPRDE